VIKQSLKITKPLQDNFTVVETSVFKYKLKTELGKVLGDFLLLPPVEAQMGYFVPIGKENSIHQYICSKNATQHFQKSDAISQLKGRRQYCFGCFIINLQ